MLHSLYTVAFLLGTAFGACLVGAFLLVADWLGAFDDDGRGGVIDLSSTEARAAMTDRRRT